MAVNTYEQKILYTGTQAAYNAATKVDTALYFTSDTAKIYKGSVDMTAAARVVTALPSSGAANNVVYILNDLSGNFVSANITVDGGANWENFSLAKATTISNASDDTKLATAKAVFDYVASVVGGDGVVADVSASTSKAATIVETDGQGTSTDVEIPGVVTKPTWDSTTRVLSIPYTAIGSTAAGTVEVNIGKDMVVTDGEYHAATEEIWMWISTHPKSEYPDDPSIKIPVASLIDELEVTDTDTVDLTYTAATNTLSADVKVSAKAGNSLTIEHGENEKGLYISLAAYALQADLQTVAAQVSDNTTNIASLYTALSGWATIA